VMVFEEAGHLQ